jgi:serine phosphatase RsbU (regulator of sigma subunit)
VVPPPVTIPPDDPVVAYFQQAPGAVELDEIDIESPVVAALRAHGVKLAVPLVSQGELIGLLNLGPRRSEQEYSVADRSLLTNLATQAAPAVRVAQLVQQRQDELRARERLEHELQVARVIQQTLLPRDVPDLPGWDIRATYRPARAVGGDFYDFLTLPDGRLGIIIGDVTDKGIPAALMMASTRSVLRAAAVGGASPGAVLQQANAMLYPDMPQHMFVTCLYAILDPECGRLDFANAGHNLPFRRRADGAEELRATGMPLGLMPGMVYEEQTAWIGEGETVLFYSDGLVEAHNGQREMFGVPRLAALVAEHPGGPAFIEYLLGALRSFAGWHDEQEDDITLVTLQRHASERGRPQAPQGRAPSIVVENDHEA